MNVSKQRQTCIPGQLFLQLLCNCYSRHRRGGGGPPGGGRDSTSGTGTGTELSVIVVFRLDYYHQRDGVTRKHGLNFLL